MEKLDNRVLFAVQHYTNDLLNLLFANIVLEDLPDQRWLLTQTISSFIILKEWNMKPILFDGIIYGNDIHMAKDEKSVKQYEISYHLNMFFNSVLMYLGPVVYSKMGIELGCFHANV